MVGAYLPLDNWDLTSMTCSSKKLSTGDTDLIDHSCTNLAVERARSKQYNTREKNSGKNINTIQNIFWLCLLFSIQMGEGN